MELESSESKRGSCLLSAYRKYILERHTGLLGYRLIKSILRPHVKERAAAEPLNSEHSHSHGQNSWR
jgi:hypothetical protein